MVLQDYGKCRWRESNSTVWIRARQVALFVQGFRPFTKRWSKEEFQIESKWLFAQINKTEKGDTMH